MSLLAPWALWFAAVAPAVVALYLLKIRRQRQIVPALEFWRRLAGPAPVRSLFQRLKRWFSLLLWLAIVACLVFSLGNPIISIGPIAPRAIVLVLDNSASMQAVEGGQEGQTRLARARAALEELTTHRPVRDEWMLIEAARRPRVLQAWTHNSRDMRAAVGGVTPHLGSADLDAAHALAAQLLAGKESPLIVMLSDGADGAISRIAAADERVLPWIVGEGRDNVGITRMSVRVHSQQAQHHAYVAVENGGGDEVQSQLVCTLDGATVDVQPFTIQAGATWEHNLVLSAPQGGVLRAHIERPDALLVDNEAFAVLEPIRPARVLLVSAPDEAYFFEQALLAMEPLVDLETSRTSTLEEYMAQESSAQAADLVIFNGAAPPQLPASGAFVCVNAWPADLPARIVGELTAPQLTIVRRDHALTQYLNPSGSSLSRAHAVDLENPTLTLATSTTGSPLIFLCRQPDRQALCLAFNVMETDLPFRNAFPIFLRNAVTYLVAQRHAWVRDQYAIGEDITPLQPLPDGVGSVQVLHLLRDAEAPTELRVQRNSFSFAQTSQPGPLRFTIGEESAFTAVNLTDAHESRIAPATSTADAASRLPLSAGVWGAVPWLVLAGLATLLIVGEWFTYHLRWTE